eukprot:PhF_6_TR36006/c0_g1_i1/m.52172/K17732/PMPCB, MAS1; mitochondrial-processing peptidase subunit beta
MKSVGRVFPAPRGIPATSVRSHLERFPKTTVSSLPNGFRIACEESQGEVATVGVWIDAGSRFETPSNNGVAHFLEHMNFKGTRSLSKSELEKKFEEIGGHLNAYTARDRTSYYVKVFKRHIADAVGTLADILRNSKIPENDLENERGTILQEMREVELLVDEVVMDHLHVAGYRDCSLGMTILGPADNIAQRINRQMILDFVSTHYTGPRMVLVGAGAVQHAELERLAQQHFGDLPPTNSKPKMPAVYTGGQYTMWSRDMATSHVAWAFETCGIDSDDIFALQVVQHLFGSFNRMNRDLMVKQNFYSTKCITDKHGLTDPKIETVNPFFTPYVDTGLLGMYIVGYPHEGNMDQHVNATIRQFAELCWKPLPEDHLALAKGNLKAMLLMNVDGTTNVAEDIGRSMLHYNRRISMYDYFLKVDEVTPERIQKVLQKYFLAGNLTMSAIGPVGCTPTLNALEHFSSKIIS